MALRHIQEDARLWHALTFQCTIHCQAQCYQVYFRAMEVLEWPSHYGYAVCVCTDIQKSVDVAPLISERLIENHKSDPTVH